MAPSNSIDLTILVPEKYPLQKTANSVLKFAGGFVIAPAHFSTSSTSEGTVTCYTLLLQEFYPFPHM
jgi:hypothetical protein